jgi:hypothetical protein
MPRKLAPILLAATALLTAADSSTTFLAGKTVQVSHTETLTLPAGGTLHLQRSFGELNIEGWDRPDVEITVIKTTKDYYSTAEAAKAKTELDRVRIASEVKDKELVVTTGYPHRSFPPSFPWAEPSIDVEYRIHVPKDAAIQVEHGTGEVHLSNVSGDIRADVRNGGITLDLAPDSKYAIQTNVDLGGVISDFPGKPHRRFWLFGHQFTGQSADGSHKLALKAGFGDIVIFKQWQPEATH